MASSSRTRRSTRQSTRQPGQPMDNQSGYSMSNNREEDILEYEAPYSSPHANTDPITDQDARELSDPPDPYRPNKYHGPPSTWRDWTAADRDIAWSLDALQARDLSVHLFNAHALKLRAARSKELNAWKPPPEWTAWPMRAKDVPRQDTQSNDNGMDESLLRGLKARQELREILLAHITRIARERFKKRECEGCDGKHSYEAHYSGPSIDASDDNETSGDLASRESDAETPQEVPSRPASSQSEASMKSAASSGSRKRKRHEYDGPELEPVPTADDDRAMKIARPSIEHIISSLEQLLNGLHVARQHYFTQPKFGSASKGKRNKNAKQADLRRSSRSQSKGKQRQGTSSEESADEIIDESLSDVDTISISTAATESARLNSRVRTIQRYGLRDWKDILGLASILGWDEDAIKRTRDRCSILFEERMSMPILDLDDQVKQLRDENDETVLIASEDETEGGVHVDGYLRPIKRRKGWRGKNKQKGNWRSRKMAREQAQIDGAPGETDEGETIGSTSAKDSPLIDASSVSEGENDTELSG